MVIINFSSSFLSKGLKKKKISYFFGRIEEYKGLDLLLESASKIFKALPDWTITVAGSGDMSKYQKWLGDKRIIVLNRYINDDEVAVLFQKTKFLVLPYKDATQSGVIPIAFSFKKPVVATRVGGIEEVVLDGINGSLIPPDSREDLVSAILDLAKDEQKRKSMGEQGYESLVNIDWSAIAEKHLKAYQQVLEE